MISEFCGWWFRTRGWKVKGVIPSDVPKAIVVAAPHTSNWDFVFALGAYQVSGLPINYVAKKELFRFPFSIIFNATGGIPVNRAKSQNFVDAIVQKFSESDRLYLIMAAEGTRKRVEKWKSGFYYAAMNAKVPIVLGFLDYAKKEAGFGDLFYPTGDKHADMLRIKQFYADKTGRNPELFNLDSVQLDP